MKTFKNPKVVISEDGKSATITGDIVDQQFSQFLVQRSTIGHLNPDNMAHPRHVQISNEAIFIKAFGNAFAMPIDDIVAIACAIEPKTSFAPKFPKPLTSLTAEVSSELDPDFQWQVTDNIAIKPVEGKSGLKPEQPIWSNVDGQTTRILNPESVKKGQWVRCVASSKAGSMTSNPVQVK